MISCDTNILYPACDKDSPSHGVAVGFLNDHSNDDRFCLCEQVLLELYCLLRNPAVTPKPLNAVNATSIIRRFRQNPRWRIIDVVHESDIMKNVWDAAGNTDFPYRRLFDARLAFTLRHHGVTEFVTRNLKDFQDFGFADVWSPF